MPQQKIIAEVGGATLAVDADVTGAELVTIFTNWVNKVDPTAGGNPPDQTILTKLLADADTLRACAATIRALGAQLNTL